MATKTCGFGSSRLLSLGLLVAASIGATNAFSWGATAHEVINSAAAQVMQSGESAFFLANEANLVTLATTPDKSWKSGTSLTAEKPLHFLDWDVLQQTALGKAMPISYTAAKKLLGTDFVATDGGAPWRVGQLFGKLVAAIKAGDCVAEIQMAGVLGHYVADLSNPMHFSSDYDGQSISKPGIHAYFESKLIDRMDRDTLLADTIDQASLAHAELDLAAPADSALDAIAISFQEGKFAFKSMPALLKIFKTSGAVANAAQDKKLQALEAPLMGIGSAAVARIWDLAVEQAGGDSGCPARAVKAPIPAWVKF